MSDIFSENYIFNIEEVLRLAKLAKFPFVQHYKQNNKHRAFIQKYLFKNDKKETNHA